MNCTNCLHTIIRRKDWTRRYNIQEAIKDEEKYPSCAMSEIKKVIGEL